MRKIRIIAISLLASLLFSGTAFAAPPKITAETAVVMDAKTGQVIYDKGMHKKMYPASITKILTTILAVENLDLDKTLVVSAEAVEAVSRDASHIALTDGEEIIGKEAVYAALLASANDACNVIAEGVSGSMDKFASFMTSRAKEMGCLGTNFTNANGLKDENHYTTAYDMAKMTQYGLANATWREMFGCRRYVMEPTNKQDEVRYLNNQHRMIFEESDRYEGIIGGKTGYTTAAKNTLVTAAGRDGMELIVVVMKCEEYLDTYEDTKALLDYGFTNYEVLTITDGEIPHKASDGTEVKLEHEVEVLVPKETKDVKKEIKVVGTEAQLVVSLGKTELGRFPLKITAKPAVNQEPIEEDGGIGFFGILLIFLLCIVGLIAGFILFLYIRKEIYLARRRRARREQRRNRR